MVETEHVACNLCGADNSQWLFEGYDRLHDLPGRFNVVRCRHCGLVYLDPRPTQDSIGDYYPDDYEPHIFFERVRHNRLAYLDYNYGMWKRRRAIERFVSHGHVLDIGCGSGSFLFYMRDQGWQTSGVEISPSAVTYVRQTLNLEVSLGDVFAANYPSNTFDLITLWNVFEHLHDPAANLVEIRRILKVGGHIVLAVPNQQSWGAKLFGPAWVGYDVPRHLYTYTPDTLKTLLTRHGFELIEWRCLFGSHQAFVNSLGFMLARHKGASWVRLLLQLVASRPARLLTMPFLRGVDVLGKGTVMIAFARSV